MPRKKLHKTTLAEMIVLYKKRKLANPVLFTKSYMRAYRDIKKLEKV